MLFFFFFNDTATTEIYTLSLHDALPISLGTGGGGEHLVSRRLVGREAGAHRIRAPVRAHQDRKSTRLNSSHTVISYAVFCLKKKKKIKRITNINNKIYQDTYDQVCTSTT